MAVIVEKLITEDIEWGTGDAADRTHPSGGNLPGTQVSLTSLSTASPDGYATTAAWDDIETISSGSWLTKEVTVNGAALGDFVLVSFDLDLEDLMLSASVTATNTVTVVAFNPTDASIGLTTDGTLKILVFKVR